MGQSTSQVIGPLGWIHELARGEVHPDAEKLLQLGRSYDPQLLVEESTVEFLAQLRERLTEYSKTFNTFSEKGSKFQEIKIYSIAQTASDFMLFRNQVKLIFSNPAHGVIQIAFAQHSRNPALSSSHLVDGQTQVQSAPVPKNGQTQELLAQLGPFRDLFWTYQGEKITADQVSKFFFIEFARTTRDLKRSRSGNQLLLDQIKALLQEKGLDL